MEDIICDYHKNYLQNPYGWNGIIHKEKLPHLLRRYNLKLKKEKTLDDMQLAFGRGLKDTFGNTAKQIEQIAKEIDKICIIANWEDAVAKYKI